MATWNHRVMRQKHTTTFTFGVHEVFYNEKGDVTVWTQAEMSPFGETLEEL